MKLFTFGDSWTEGVGCDLAKENKIISKEEKTIFRNSLSWPTQLAHLLNIDVENYGEGASSNKRIFENVSQILKTNRITEGDLVVIMWSSSLRDDLPFFPENEWHIWGNRFKEKKHIFNTFLNKKHSTNSKYNNGLGSYKLFFMENLFSDIYYDYVNQNYVLFLQHMFENLNIRYVFCDAFDSMFSSNINNEIDNTRLIHSSHYWGFKEKTMKDYLTATNDPDVWEDFNLWGDSSGKHPNKHGYKLIANELFRFINNNQILSYPLINKFNLI
jgi:lysophospholipase L1-like esterase